MMILDRDDRTTSNSEERGNLVEMTTSCDLLRLISSILKDMGNAKDIFKKRHFHDTNQTGNICKTRRNNRDVSHNHGKTRC